MQWHRIGVYGFTPTNSNNTMMHKQVHAIWVTRSRVFSLLCYAPMTTCINNYYRQNYFPLLSYDIYRLHGRVESKQNEKYNNEYDYLSSYLETQAYLPIMHAFFDVNSDEVALPFKFDIRAFVTDLPGKD